MPFAFEAGNASLPAGTYIVSSVDERGIKIDNAKGAPGDPADDAARRVDEAQAAKLVFHVYENQYFLSEVRSDTNEGMKVPASKHEQELRTARNVAGSSEVVVALR